ncbi:MAG: DUF1653 domain-containing protein [Candidatus Paceibacterota bacterium]
MINKVVVGGIYSHYKNPSNTYKVIDIAKNSTDLSDMVIYEAQYENTLAKLWVRPIEEFCGEVIVEGKKVKRFEKID